MPEICLGGYWQVMPLLGKERKKLPCLECFFIIFSLLLGSPAVHPWARHLQTTLCYLFEKKLRAAFRVVTHHFLLTMIRIALKSSIVWLKLLLQNVVLLGDFESWGFDPASI